MIAGPWLSLLQHSDLWPEKILFVVLFSFLSPSSEERVQLSGNLDLPRPGEKDQLDH